MNRSIVIKQLIKARGLSMKAFARNADMPYTTLYSTLERDGGNTSGDNLIKICDALEISFKSLQEMEKICESNPEINISEEYLNKYKGTNRELDLTIPEEYSKKFRVTSRDKAQHIEFMKKEAEAFFMDDKFDDEDKKEILDTMNEIFWKAKTLNKRKPKDK